MAANNIIKKILFKFYICNVNAVCGFFWNNIAIIIVGIGINKNFL